MILLFPIFVYTRLNLIFQVYFDLYEQELERFEHSTKPDLKITATSEQELDAAVDTIKMHM